MGDLYLLDTNILVHSVRADEVWNRIQATYSLFLADPIPLICVVSVGELLSLAFQFIWQAARRDRMRFVLDHFEWANIDRESVLDAYASLDAHSRATGRELGKNDLWIAATAHALGARLLTTDRDFDRLYPAFIQRDWIDPTPPPGGP